MHGKFQCKNSKFQTLGNSNLKIQNFMSKPFDLEERTYLFARDCRLYVKKLPKSISNMEDGKQLLRSSGSIGANYIEANEKLGDKDFLFRVKIARKEAKESKYWIRLLQDLNSELTDLSIPLFEEAEELRKNIAKDKITTMIDKIKRVSFSKFIK